MDATSGGSGRYQRTTMGKHTLFTTAPLLSLLLIACSEYAGQPEPLVNGPNAPVADAPKAPPVQGAPQSTDLVETLGVFVTEKGNDAGDGSRTRPFATIQHGIDVAMKVGKRVYVCAGSYSESLTIADSISVIGGLDCSQLEWKPASADARSKIVAPTSPAITARGITSATRVSNLDVLAPNATQESGSSIGLLAERAPALVVASSSITAGDGAKGKDGSDGVQLVQTGTLDGTPSQPWAVCSALTCKLVAGNRYEKPGGNAGATSVCSGAPGHDGEMGGTGGSGGLYRVVRDEAGSFVALPYENNPANLAEGGGSRTSAVGAAGVDGANAALVGTLGAEGYAPASGVAGTDGQPGKGGSGGAGAFPSFLNLASYEDATIRGMSGAGGGAGGCPGLAGQPGGGGGASIAVALVESPIVLEDTRVASGTGGAPGLGSFGSRPSRGGSANGGTYPEQAGMHGGNGGVAGTSSNGSAGPSFGVAHVGAAPTLKGATKVEQGKGGAGVEARTKTQGVGGDVSIAATPDGLSEAIHAF